MQIEQEVMDKVLSEMKGSNAHAMEQIQFVYEQQVKMIKIHCDEKLEELTRQNDGLLGAVGRLQAERAEAVKKLEEHKAQERQRGEDMRLRTVEFSAEMEIEHEKTREEISGYKKQIAELQAKLKKQGKK